MSRVRRVYERWLKLAGSRLTLDGCMDKQPSHHVAWSLERALRENLVRAPSMRAMQRTSIEMLTVALPVLRREWRRLFDERAKRLASARRTTLKRRCNINRTVGIVGVQQKQKKSKR